MITILGVDATIA